LNEFFFKLNRDAINSACVPEAMERYGLLLFAELRARINFFQKMMILLERSYLPQLLAFSLNFATIVVV
jgi:hypothetical protein